MLLVGDSEIDVRTARAANVAFCGVTWGFGSDAVRAANAEHLVDHPEELVALVQDRKSTRLNSSHVESSYAVFCLKKKKETSSPSHPQSQGGARARVSGRIGRRLAAAAGSISSVRGDVCTHRIACLWLPPPVAVAH